MARKKDLLKTALKNAFAEILEENEDLVRQIFEEVIEDAFMSKAIKDARSSHRVSREKIFRTLASSAK